MKCDDNHSMMTTNSTLSGKFHQNTSVWLWRVIFAKECENPIWLITIVRFSFSAWIRMFNSIGKNDQCSIFILNRNSLIYSSARQERSTEHILNEWIRKMMMSRHSLDRLDSDSNHKNVDALMTRCSVEHLLKNSCTDNQGDTSSERSRACNRCTMDMGWMNVIELTKS